MRQQLNFKVIHAGAFKSAEKTYEQVVEFASTLEPHQLVSITSTHEGKMIVWYRAR